MSSWLARAFGYGLGARVGRAIFGASFEEKAKEPQAPIRQQTEEEILADEKRYDEEAKRLDAEDAARAAHRR